MEDKSHLRESNEFTGVDTEENVDVKSCSVNEFGEEEPSDDRESNDADLDVAIEEAAKRRNLSAQNVKSIIHHVLKDKRVLALAQKHASPEEEEVPTDEWDLESVFEPKLTRSRVRQAVASSIASGQASPEKKHVHLCAPSPVDDTVVAEESSDDEYDPEIEDIEEEDDDDDDEEIGDGSEEKMMMMENKLTDEKESTSKGVENVSRFGPQSDTSTTESTGAPAQDSPSNISHPLLKEDVSSSVDDERTEEALIQETATLLASLSDVILSPIKAPKIDTSEKSYEVHSESEGVEIIAKRTRSKYPLVDTSLSAIEASFVPPDAEDPATPMELDPEDLEWQAWLNNLLNPSESLNVPGGGEEEVEDLDDDVEYNYLADQEEVEKEEFRNDRAVKISKKEVDDLLNELLNPSGVAVGGFLSGDGLDLTGAYLLESIGLHPQPSLQSSADTPTISGENVAASNDGSTKIGCCLSKEQSTQLWIQIQQHFQLLMQTFVLVRYEPSLQFLAKIAAQAVKEIGKFCTQGMEGIPKESSLWHVLHLDEGLKLVQELDPDNKDAVQTSPALGSHPHKVPAPVQSVLMQHALFWENPHLLPTLAFDPLSSKDTSSNVKYFSTEEDYLLILGMDHYGSSAWKIIQENLFQTKTARQLQLRVKNRCSNRTGENAIKHYRRTKEVKIPFKDEQFSTLPQWVIRYHTKSMEREKQLREQEKKREKENERKKLAAVIGSVLEQSTLLQSNPTLQTMTSGSKRNLCGKLDELESESKRRHTTVAVVKPTVKPTRRHHQQKRTKSCQSSSKSKQASPTVSSSHTNNQSGSELVKGNVQELLFAAGLETSEPDVRFACDYLTEVKATLCRDHNDVYQAFLDSLLKAKTEKWNSKKIFDEVDKLLKPWPHLMKLFVHFLTPEDCVRTNLLEEKADLESAIIFAKSLQEKFRKSPVKIGEITTKLQQLEDSGASVKMVQESLLPHIEMHEELVRELKQFLFQLAPSARSDDVYEEINLVGELDRNQLDDFEEIVITDANTSLPSGFVRGGGGSCTDDLEKEPLSPRDPEDAPCHCDLEGVGSHEKPQTSNAACLKLSQPSAPLDQTQNVEDAVMDQSHAQVGSSIHSTSHSSSQERTESVTDKDSELCSPCGFKPPKWTRKQDKLILQMCLKSQNDEASLNRTVAEIASSLKCDIKDVHSRFQELMTLFRNSNKL